MNSKALFFFLLLNFIFLFLTASAQNTTAPIVVNTIDSNNNFLTVVYDMKVKTDKQKTGIEETYNGGIKTVFIDNDKARVRLVSLMRIQSIFFLTSPGKSNGEVLVVKESGKNKYKYHLTNEQWNLYNNKYEDDSCQLTNDSAVILNYPCKKAIITLKDGRTLTAYYTTQLKPVSSKIEPAFNHIPGLVLQYEYSYKKGIITYSASKVSQDYIAANVFKIPAKGYVVKKHCLKCRNKKEDNAFRNLEID